MARRVVVEIVGDSTKLERAFKRSEQQARTFNATIARSGRSLASQAGLAAGGLGITAAFTDAIKVASDFEEQMSKTEAVFGRSAATVEAWSRTTTQAFGISERQALSTASSFGALFAPLGIAGDEAAKLAEQLTERGADLAAFYNTNVQDALDAIRSGLVGEMEPLRRYGALLLEGRVKQQAMADTGKDNAAQLTNQEKALARVKIILQDTNIAAGNFAATQDQLAEKMKVTQAELDNLKVKLGEDLVPAATSAVGALGGLVDAFEGVNSWLRTHQPFEFLPTKNLGFLTRGVKDIGKAFDETQQKLGDTFQQGPMRGQGVVPIGLPPLFPSGAGTTRAGLTDAEKAERARKIALRNTIFDAAVARRLNRLQDLSLRNQLEGLRAVAAQIRARIAATKDATRRLNLEDQLLQVMREQRSVQEQITDSIKAGNQALKDRAEAIKSAILDRLQQRQQARENQRALADARDQLRIARQMGGPQGIKEAIRNLQDVQFDIQRAALERAPATLKGGLFTLGTITVNVYGSEDPEQVARKVVEVIQRRRRHSTTQTRGPTTGTYAGPH